jgi:hypothetical protein
MQNRVALAVAVACEYGFPARERRVLSAGVLTTVVEIGGLVVRVAEPGFSVGESVAIAAHAAARGGPVVPPARIVDPGPHYRQGMVVSFWERVASEPAEPRVAGRRLRELHEALADFPSPLADFGHPTEALRRLGRVAETADHELLRGALSLPVEHGQALHGDAAVSNCIAGGDWIDFDLAARGPREADVATLVMRDWVHRRDGESAGALVAYGPCDRELIHVYLRKFVALTCVLLLEQATSQPPLAPLLAERLTWLRMTR